VESNGLRMGHRQVSQSRFGELTAAGFFARSCSWQSLPARTDRRVLGGLGRLAGSVSAAEKRDSGVTGPGYDVGAACDMLAHPGVGAAYPFAML
jgi:hypothetical protein